MFCIVCENFTIDKFFHFSMSSMPCHILETEDFAISFVKPTKKLCCKADTSQEFDFSDGSQTDRSLRCDNLPFSIADHLVENPTFTASIAKKVILCGSTGLILCKFNKQCFDQLSLRKKKNILTVSVFRRHKKTKIAILIPLIIPLQNRVEFSHHKNHMFSICSW